MSRDHIGISLSPGDVFTCQHTHTGYPEICKKRTTHHTASHSENNNNNNLDVGIEQGVTERSAFCSFHAVKCGHVCLHKNKTKRRRGRGEGAAVKLYIFASLSTN